MSEESTILQVAVIFLLAAVLAVPLAKKLKLGAVLGYLLAGVVIGPSALGLIAHPQSISNISELGVVLLLFIIGLELSPRRLWVMRKSVFGIGLAQVLLTGIVIGAVALLAFNQPLNVAVVLGLGLALSSTAFGLQILAERKELTSPHGRLAFSILLLQDIAAIPLIAMIPLLSGHASQESGSGMQHALLAIGSIAIVVIGGRYLLRPVFRIVAKTGIPEVSTATALLIVIGTAWLMDEVGISMALGAFLAGLILADSEYRHELEAQINPFKGLLLGLFFMGVGMSADLGLLIDSPLTVVLLTLLLIALKLPVLYLLGRLAGGLKRSNALQLGLVLAAGGEFAFVVFQMAADQALFDERLHGLLVLAITLSMALTPLLLMACAPLFDKEEDQKQEVPDEYRQIEDENPRVVISGMGRMGQIVARIMRAQRVSLIALDTSVETIELTRTVGDIPVFYGDPLNPEILHAARVDKAEFFIIATEDVEISLKTAELLRHLYPKLKIIARARNRQHVFRLLDLGVTPIRETYYSSLEMSRLVLRGMGLDAEQAEERIQRFKQHDEKILQAQYEVYDDDAAVIQTAQEARGDLEKLFESDALEKKGID